MSDMIAGVDEAGVCPIAGPVVAAAVILNPKQAVYKLRDSKILSAKQRDILFDRIMDRALAVNVGIASVEEIDRLNIYHANLLAMKRAIEGLALTPTRVLIDGRSTPNISVPSEAIVRGDSLVKVISAASIIAKVTRDRIMETLHTQFPQYRFDKHKGYPTAAHRALLEEYGVCPIHRHSFAIVKNRAARLTPAESQLECVALIS